VIARAVGWLKKLKTPDRDTWGSHRYLFRKLFAITGDLDTIVEYGCGHWSTDFLAGHCKRLITVEENQKWLNSVKGRCAHRDNIEYEVEDGNVADLVFVDCVREDRQFRVQQAIQLQTSHIVIHDWERQKFYKYDQLSIPQRYMIYVDKTVAKWTALLTMEEEVYAKLVG